MEKVAWFFDSDFEERLFSEKMTSFTSTKRTQEFEYFISLLKPNDFIYSTKKYQIEYIQFIEEFTKSEFLITNKNKNITPWNSDYKDLDFLKKLQSKIMTLEFGKRNGFYKHEVNIVKDIKKLKDNFIYKYPYSVSGQGNYVFPKDQTVIEKLIEKHQLIEEERLERIFDFSSLIINNELILTYQNFVDEYFQYKGTLISEEPIFSHELELQYQTYLEKVLDYSKSYKGVMSVDGFLYTKNGQTELNPMCEINARKTMGYFTCEFKKKYFRNWKSFKLLLIRNKKTLKTRPMLENSKGGYLLISPLENIFNCFVIYGPSNKDLFEMENELLLTYF